MNTHLVKCKRSYPDAKLVECDFNVNHKISEPELQVRTGITAVFFTKKTKEMEVQFH